MKKLQLFLVCPLVVLGATACAAEVGDDDAGVPPTIEALESLGCAGPITTPAPATGQSKPMLVAEYVAQTGFTQDQPNSFVSFGLTSNTGRWLGNFARPGDQSAGWVYVGSDVRAASGCTGGTGVNNWRYEVWGASACFTQSACFDGFGRLQVDGVPSAPPPRGYSAFAKATLRVRCDTGERVPGSAIMIEQLTRLENGQHKFYSGSPDIWATACRCVPGSNCI